MEIKEEPKGQECNQCKSKDIVWSLQHKKPFCRNCMSFDIISLVKKWVAVDDLMKILNKDGIDDDSLRYQQGWYIGRFIQNLSNSRP